MKMTETQEEAEELRAYMDQYAKDFRVQFLRVLARFFKIDFWFFWGFGLVT